MSVIVLAVMLASVSMVSAIEPTYDASVDLVQKNSTDWSVVPGGNNGTLSYTMGCDEVMDYNFTMNGDVLELNTKYCLVFYTRDNGGISWLNEDNEVWGNQDSGLIDRGITDLCCGKLDPMIGTFDFSDYGLGLECIDDGDDYDGSVCGGKVWLVPCADWTPGAVTGWHPDNALFEEDLVEATEPCCELEVNMDECVCQNDSVEIEVNVECTCGVEEVKVLFQQPDGETIETVELSNENSFDGTLTKEATINMSGLYYVDIVVTPECGEDVTFDNATTLTVDTTSPVINEVKAAPDTISLLWNYWGYCHPDAVLQCYCEACTQTYSFGPDRTILEVNVTDECIGMEDGEAQVTMNYTAVLYQVFGDKISEFSGAEQEALAEELSDYAEDVFYLSGEERDIYCNDIWSLGVVFDFWDACGEAGIDIDFDELVTILLQKANLGSIDIPIKATDRCGNNETGIITVRIVDYQMPLEKGWNVRSVPVTLADSTWQDLAIDSGLKYSVAWKFENGQWVEVHEGSTLEPLDAIYVYMTDRDQLPVNIARGMTGPPTKQLSTGWNLVGAAVPLFETMRADLYLKSVEKTPDGNVGYTNVMSLQQKLDYYEEVEHECGNDWGVRKWFVQKPWVFTSGQEWPHYTEGYGDEWCYGHCSETCTEECGGFCGMQCRLEFEWYSEPYLECVTGCIGGCEEQCVTDCETDCFSWWYEETGEIDNPKRGQHHYLCKYWMDNGGGYWIYMENNGTLIGFTSTPVSFPIHRMWGPR